MQLLLIRHGLPERVENDNGEVADPSLSEVGRQQAQALARHLSQEHLDAIYASTAARAVETAAPLAADRAVEVPTREALVEYDFGSSAYIPIEEVGADHPEVAKWLPWFQPLEEGSDPARFRERVTTAMTEIVQDHKSQTVAVVCHAGTINAYLSGLMGLERAMLFVPDYTSVSRLSVSSGGFWTLECLNERTHLAALADARA
jgi:2,3-bisphosphoglycerate-dependent phosphoglycerate mutase